MIAETIFKDHGFPLSLGHLVVNQPSNGQGNPAEDDQRSEWFEQQAPLPRFHRRSIAEELKNG